MKMRNKGKVHPSPSSSSPSPSSSSATTNKDALSVFKLLPAAILTLASVLSLEDKEVLAYMITWCIKTTVSPSNVLEEKAKKNSNSNSKNIKNVSHRPPVFDCECFDCYTSYWFKWDSSSNRELIHQALEAFEEHLNNNSGELSSSPLKSKGRNKKRDKLSRRGAEKVQEIFFLESQESWPETHVQRNSSLEIHEGGKGSPEIAELGMKSGRNEVKEELDAGAAPAETAAAAVDSSSHKGLARKVLPDVLGLFNSRLWRLWSPDV